MQDLRMRDDSGSRIKAHMYCTVPLSKTLYSLLPTGLTQENRKQEGQEALNHSPEYRYRYLLKAGHVPGDTWGPGVGPILPGAKFEQTW